jgi:hypothetical protein
MAENLTANVPDILRSVQTRHLFTIRLDVKPIIVIGATPAGFKRVGVVPGGVFEGERLTGVVLDGGSDWQTLRTDHSVLLDVRLNLKTDDDQLIAMTYRGLRAGEKEILQRIDAGEPVDPETYYFRTNAMFETASPKYGWLNNILAVGVGFRGEKGVTYNLFEVL